MLHTSFPQDTHRVHADRQYVLRDVSQHIFHRNPVTWKLDVGMHLVCCYAYYSCLCTSWPCHPYYFISSINLAAFYTCNVCTCIYVCDTLSLSLSFSLSLSLSTQIHRPYQMLLWSRARNMTFITKQWTMWYVLILYWSVHVRLCIWHCYIP